MADVDRFARAVTYTHPRNKTHPTMVWFWEAVRAWPDATRRKLLKFWTSSHYVDIYAVNPNTPLTLGISDVAADTTDAQIDALFPRAATCFRQMSLPPFTTKAALERQMLEAITHHSEGLGQL
jgi:hypothetical protein